MRVSEEQREENELGREKEQAFANFFFLDS